jgi:hypothetical protein
MERSFLGNQPSWGGLLLCNAGVAKANEVRYRQQGATRSWQIKEYTMPLRKRLR